VSAAVAADTRTDRLALGGLVFAICGAVSAAFLPKPPDVDASARSVRSYLGHTDRILTGSVLSVLAAVSFLVFLAALRSRVEGAYGRAVVAAGGALGAVTVLGATLQAGLVHAQPRLDGSAVLGGFAVMRAVFYVSPPCLMIVVAGAVAVAGRSLPAWTRGLSALLAVVAAVGSVLLLTSTSSVATGVGLAGFLLTIVWAAATSITISAGRAGGHAE
jgi:hypothetical protein